MMILRVCVVLFAALAPALHAAEKPSRDVIERHRDPRIFVHGRFAAVKLPIAHGVAIWNPTAIARGPDGTMFVANFTGEIFSLRDSDGDGLEDTAKLFADVREAGLRRPTSLAFRGDELFVATTEEIRVYRDADGDGVADGSRTFFAGFPHTSHRLDFTFALCFATDGSLFFILPTDSTNPAPAPDPQKWRGSILRVSPDGTQVERFATGLRFAYGMVAHPSGDLFFTDNKGGGNPTEELNFAVAGRFYGHHPEKFPDHSPTQPPLVSPTLGTAMTGLCFNPVSNEFGGTGGDLFVAAWGPDFMFDRGSIFRVRLFPQPGGGYRAQELPFAHEVPKATAIAFGPQGDLYATLFGRETHGHLPAAKPEGAIYRFIAADWIKPAKALQSDFPLVKGNAEAGKQLFAERGCAGCHAFESGETMLGPDLGGLGEFYSLEEMLASIRHPSAGIKTGFETEKCVLRSGETVVGRLFSSSPEAITLVVPGNAHRRIERSEIASQETLATSLMPEGLVTGLREPEIENLLAYLGVRDRRPGWWQRNLRKAEEFTRPIFPSLRFRTKVAALVAVVAGTLIVWRWRARKRTLARGE